MRRSHKIILGTLAGSSLILGGANLAVYHNKTDAPQERIEEDDPRWDCRTMGNKICGPTNAAAYDAGQSLAERFLNDDEVHDNLIEQCEGVQNDPFCDAVHEYQDRRIVRLGQAD